MKRYSFDGIIKRRASRKPLNTRKPNQVRVFEYEKPRSSREKLLKEKRRAQEKIKKAEGGNKPSKKKRSKIKRLKSKKKRLLTLKRSVALAVIAVLVVAGTLFYKAFASGADIFANGHSPIKKLTDAVTKQENPIKGEGEDRIDIMLLGIGGDGHEGSQLTDTIQVLSIKPSAKEVAMLSIPRDLYVNLHDPESYMRINEVNFTGMYNNYEDEMAGLELTKGVVEEITGEQIEYSVKLDFEGFRDIVDALGGVEIDVEHSFMDTEYPLGLGYQTIQFQAGMQKMDGEQALQFARSRKGYVTDGSNAVEGTDFARSKRQQKVIAAAKEKALTVGVLANPARLNDLFNALDEHLLTDMEMWEAIRLVSLVEEISPDTIKSQVLSSEEDNYLKPYQTGGASLLIPLNGISEYSDIHELVANIFKIPSEEETELAEGEEKLEASLPVEEVEETVVPENATIELWNGSGVTGLANQTSVDLETQGVNAEKIGNADHFGYQKTLIYDFSDGENPNTAKELESFFGVSAQKAPDSLFSDHDFLVIIGIDYAS